jgi:ferredoxin
MLFKMGISMFFKRKKKVSINFNGMAIEGKQSNTILQSVLKKGGDIKYNCGSGTCGQCRFHLVTGEVKSDVVGSLACRTYPQSDIEIAQF